jgi:small subunit ribosomal protein S2
MAYKIDPRDLLKTGAHFGHNSSRWHPKMKPYIYDKKDGVHIIDLVITAEMLEKALTEVEKITEKGGKVLFVSTKRQAREAVAKAAEDTGMAYINNRWPGGMLTNWKTMTQRIAKLKQLEKQMASGELAAKYNKLELQRLQEEIDDMNELYGGVKDLDGAPQAVFVADILVDPIAIKEANKLSIPVFAIVDTNTDPSKIDFPIPANDDAIKAVTFIIEQFAAAVNNGKSKIRKQAGEEK